MQIGASVIRGRNRGRMRGYRLTSFIRLQKDFVEQRGAIFIRDLTRVDETKHDVRENLHGSAARLIENGRDGIAGLGCPRPNDGRRCQHEDARPSRHSKVP